MNAAVSRSKTAKQGGTVLATLNPRTQKLVKMTDSFFDEAWEEGSSMTSLRSTMGGDRYVEGLRCGDIVERKSSAGKMLAYQPKERASGRTRSFDHKAIASRDQKFDSKDSVAYSV